MNICFVFPKTFEVFKFFEFLNNDKNIVYKDVLQIDSSIELNSLLIIKKKTLDPSNSQTDKGNNNEKALFETSGISNSEISQGNNNEKTFLKTPDISNSETHKVNNSEMYYPFPVYDIKYHNYYHFTFLVIDESDINFRKILQAKWEKVSETNNNHHVLARPTLLLMGSCGSPNKVDFQKFFIIENAHKYDRGELREDRVFVSRSTKVLKNAHSLEIFTLNRLKNSVGAKKDILTTNFINQAKIDDEENYKDCLLDMETWDFYDICEYLKKKGLIGGYGSIRFVTDLAFNPSEEVLNKKKVIETLSQFGNDIPIFEFYQKLYDQIDHSGILKSMGGNNFRDSSTQKKLIRRNSQYNFSFIFDFLLPCYQHGCHHRTDTKDSFKSYYEHYKTIAENKDKVPKICYRSNVTVIFIYI
ncbi:hypothetical protein DICPUDRAFT_156425 [Dictyostelium purpureum]|uniref:Uncharacterized protein n=1 Tax=Dictyostelium purpureum TaxID=5786 RepID=F0ZWJ3_DICPU|nr:uncharacterized protein DICPUDRAFT_156425 [Dictyostelium purpureum]EGC31685.1 hypothetical protein DICPUDRAFT_156425 [Dictyostelium purpureum]|eukprot:XP_003291783.1 hypothetical protein DICPUDRAFT_156425 [Dictyostelium purpureum]